MNLYSYGNGYLATSVESERNKQPQASRRPSSGPPVILLRGRIFIQFVGAVIQLVLAQIYIRCQTKVRETLNGTIRRGEWQPSASSATLDKHPTWALLDPISNHNLRRLWSTAVGVLVIESGGVAKADTRRLDNALVDLAAAGWC